MMRSILKFSLLALILVVSTIYIAEIATHKVTIIGDAFIEKINASDLETASQYLVSPSKHHLQEIWANAPFKTHQWTHKRIKGKQSKITANAITATGKSIQFELTFRKVKQDWQIESIQF